MDDASRRLRLEALFAAYAPAVLAYARRRVGSAMAEDVLGDVFVVAWRRLDDAPGDPLPWLLVCARLVIGNYARADRRRGRLLARLAAEIATDELPIELSNGAVGRALAGLSERDRETLLLVAWDGLTAERAAVVAGCSPQAFRVRAHRARRRFARALQAADLAATDQIAMEACNE